MLITIDLTLLPGDKDLDCSVLHHVGFLDRVTGEYR